MCVILRRLNIVFRLYIFHHTWIFIKCWNTIIHFLVYSIVNFGFCISRLLSGQFYHFIEISLISHELYTLLFIVLIHRGRGLLTDCQINTSSFWNVLSQQNLMKNFVDWFSFHNKIVWQNQFFHNHFLLDEMRNISFCNFCSDYNQHIISIFEILLLKKIKFFLGGGYLRIIF